MGRYTTLDEEVKHFKKMALITEEMVQTKPPCGCEKPENNNELIMSDKLGENNETQGVSPEDQQMVDAFVSRVDCARFYRAIGGVTQVPTDKGVIYSPISGDGQIYFAIGEFIANDANANKWYAGLPQTIKMDINEEIINALAQKCKLEW
jgi:hypothetical protein